MMFKPGVLAVDLPLRWADGEIIGTATVYPDGRVEATITDDGAKELFAHDLTGISLVAREAFPR